MASFSIESSKLRQFIDSINFDHFLVLTDETGMLQHSKFSIPDRRLGYTTDDNARALVISVRQHDFTSDKMWLVLASGGRPRGVRRVCELIVQKIVISLM